MDSNGYNKSIMDTEEGRDFVLEKLCGMPGEVGQTVRHEIYGGPNRKNSKRYGLWVNISPDTHRMIHAIPESGINKALKMYGQREFEKTHTRAEFMEIFGRSYL